MMHKAWSSIEEVPYCFSRSSVKFQCHTALKIVEFDPNWAFPDCNSSLNSPMAMKCCTKLETAKERCLIVFQGHPSNFKVTRYKTSPIMTQIGRFRTIGRSQLSNPSDLPCYFLSCKSYVTNQPLEISLNTLRPRQNGQYFAHCRFNSKQRRSMEISLTEFSERSSVHRNIMLFMFDNTTAVMQCWFFHYWLNVQCNLLEYGLILSHISQCSTLSDFILPQ